MVATGLRATGYIPLDLSSLREIASDDVQNLAAHGGLLASDSAPSIARENGATDKGLVVTWAAGVVAEAQFGNVAKPVDLDSGQDLTVHLSVQMSGATDTPTIDVQVYDGVGDTEMGGATAALSATLAELTATITAADLAAAPGFLAVNLVPAAHATDAIQLRAAWIEYQRLTQS